MKTKNLRFLFWVAVCSLTIAVVEAALGLWLFKSAPDVIMTTALVAMLLLFALAIFCLFNKNYRKWYNLLILTLLFIIWAITCFQMFCFCLSYTGRPVKMNKNMSFIFPCIFKMTTYERPIEASSELFNEITRVDYAVSVELIASVALLIFCIIAIKRSKKIDIN